MPSYYDVLGLPRNASDKEVRQAYRKLAREHHPDVNHGNKASEDKFKQINEAYGVLSDLEKRHKYDKYGDNWANWEQIEEAQARARRGGAFHRSAVSDGDTLFTFGDGRRSPFEDILGNIGRDLHRPPPAEFTVTVTLEEAFQGTTRVLELPQGRRLEVKIPQGVNGESRIRVATEGERRGVVYLVVTLRKHSKFQRKGNNLYIKVDVALQDAVLGGEITVPTLTGNVALRIPPETQNGRRFRLAGQGMPELNEPDQRGDLYATMNVMLPENLTPEQRDLFLQLRESLVGNGG